MELEFRGRINLMQRESIALQRSISRLYTNAGMVVRRLDGDIVAGHDIERSWA